MSVGDRQVSNAMSAIFGYVDDGSKHRKVTSIDKSDGN